MINLLFSIAGPRLTDEQSNAFAAFGQWTVLNERVGRLFVDGIGEYQAIDNALAALTAMGRQPVTIGGWRQSGEPLARYPFNLDAYLAVAPDAYDTTDPENPVPVRPTSYTQSHAWAGWSPHE